MKQFLQEPFTFDRTVRIGLFVLSSLLALALLAFIWEVLLPFLLAGIFAYVMMPFVRFFQTTLGVRRRGLAVFLVFLISVGLLSLGVLYLIPAIEDEVVKTIEVLKLHSGSEGGLLSKILPQELSQQLQEQFNFRQFVEQLSLESIISTGEDFLDKAGGLISSTLSVFSWGLVFAMGVVYFVFIMMDMEGLVHGLVSMFPHTARPTVYAILKEVDYYMDSYFRGQALIALSVGLMLCVGFSLIGLPLAIVLGIFIGLLNFIPYMQAIGVIPLTLAAILMALQSGGNIWMSIAMAYAVLFFVQLVQDSVLIPKIMGSRMGMRPSLILLALAIWGYLLGFFGMLIALPATMSFYAIYMRYILKDEAYIELIKQKMERRKQRAKLRTQKAKG